jgi:general secretion pathway protein C
MRSWSVSRVPAAVLRVRPTSDGTAGGGGSLHGLKLLWQATASSERSASRGFRRVRRFAPSRQRELTAGVGAESASLPQGVTRRIQSVSMNSWLKQRFWLVVAALLLPCAYFQARGITYLLRARLSVMGLRQAGAVGAQPEAPRAGRPNAADATPILARNPFDSETGPLNRRPVSAPVKRLDLSDPLHAPECDGFRAESTMVSNDPYWSSAVVQGPGDDRGKVRRVGQTIGGKEVAYIGFNPVKRSPAVWLVSDATLCQTEVFSAQKDEPVGQKQAKKRLSPKPRRRTPALPAAIAQGIHRVNPTEYLVRRSAVDAVLENQSLLMKSARLQPRKTADRTSIVLSRVRSGSLLAHIGLRRGDEIVAINGYPLASPEKALEAYARLRTAAHLQLELRRAGKPVTIDYRIQ